MPLGGMGQRIRCVDFAAALRLAAPPELVPPIGAPLPISPFSAGFPAPLLGAYGRETRGGRAGRAGSGGRQSRGTGIAAALGECAVLRVPAAFVADSASGGAAPGPPPGASRLWTLAKGGGPPFGTAVSAGAESRRRP